MENSSYSYALIKTLYDRGDDYIDSFWPLILKVLPKSAKATLAEIAQKIQDRYHLKIELFLLKTIVGRAHKKEYLDFESGVRQLYSISEKGSVYLDGLEAEDDVQRRINALTESIKQYFAEHGLKISEDHVSELLKGFIANNLEKIVDFLNPSGQRAIFNKSFEIIDKADEINLIEYFQQAKNSKPNEYKTIQEMVYGSIISALLFVKDSNELTQLQEKPFKNCDAFIDTNVLFSLLGFHAEELNEATKDLIEQMKRSGFRLKVFDFTIDELSRVVGGYTREADMYPSDLKVDSVYSVMKRRGWSITEVNEFLMNIEEVIEDFGITVERCPEINLQHYQPESENLKSALLAYKPSSGTSSINHDIAAIEKIRKMRRRSVRFVEDAKVFFLSANTALQRFDLSEFGHRDNGTIGEVILDRLLANLLWLKHPSTLLPLETIIAAHSRDLMINRQVWAKFYSVVEKLQKDKKVGRDQLVTLFYHNRIGEILRFISTDNVNGITEEFILDEIEKASKEAKQEHQKIIDVNEKLIDQLSSVEAAKNEVQQAKNRVVENSTEEIRRISKSLRGSSVTTAKSRSYVFWILSIFLTLIIEYWVCLWLRNFLSVDTISRLRILFGSDFAIGVVTIMGLTFLRKPFEKWYVERLYKAKLREASLEKNAA